MSLLISGGLSVGAKGRLYSVRVHDVIRAVSRFFWGHCYFKGSLAFLLASTMVACREGNFESLKSHMGQSIQE